MGGIFGPLFDDQLALSRLTSRSCLQCDERWAGRETRFQSSPHRFGRLEKPGESALAFFLVIRRLLPPIWPTSHQAQSDHQKCISLRGCSFVVCNSLARASRFRVQEVGFCACRSHCASVGIHLLSLCGIHLFSFFVRAQRTTSLSGTEGTTACLPASL